MKKVIAMLLVLAMALGLAACGAAGSKSTGSGGAETTAEPETVFSVGYGKTNITPESSVPLQGYGKVDQRMSTGILSYLWATCAAITDAEGNTILIYGLDLCGSSKAVDFRTTVSEATGVPADNICMSASHTHSAPATGSTSVSGIPEYNKLLEKRLVEAAEMAMADRKPAEMYGATVETEGLNFVRRYVCNDGTYAGDNYGDTSSGISHHESEVDNTMQLIKFVREGGKDVIITNFQTHPHRTGGSQKYDISADIVGEFRDALSAELDCEVVYFTGGSGNVNPTSRIKDENIYSDFREHGKAMAKAALQAEGNYVKIETGKVQATSSEFTADINHEFDSLAGVCKDLYSQWNANEITTAELKELGLSYGIALNSPYHANGIANRSTMPATGTFTIWTFSFGDVGFVVAPYEMFDATGKDIKAASPFAMTIIATCANGGNGYFPTLLGFDHGGYSVDTTKYVRGSAERLGEQYVSMLEGLYAAK